MNKYECQFGCGKGHKFKEIKIQETSILQKKGVNFYDLCRITVLNMLIMEILRDLILILVPSLLVGTVVYLLLKDFRKTELERLSHSNDLEKFRLVAPLRLQAYERMILLLERIAPSQLIMRNIQPEQSAASLQNVLISNIRQEFEHNLSQQVYISSNAWELIKNAREAVVSDINSAAEKLNSTATATDLAQLIFEDDITGDASTLYKALEFLKQEVRANYF